MNLKTSQFTLGYGRRVDVKMAMKLPQVLEMVRPQEPRGRNLEIAQ